MFGDGMDHFTKLVSAVVFSFACVGAHAGYAQLAPPPGWSAGTGGAVGLFNGVAAGNSAQFLESTVRTNASLNVGGRAVSIPATLRFAANAPRFAASFLFLNPAVRTAAGIATWLGVGKIIYDAAQDLWLKINEGQIEQWYFNGVAYPSLQAQCDAMVALWKALSPNQTITAYAYQDHYCIRVVDGYETSYGPFYPDIIEAGSTRPLSKEEFEKELAPEVFRPGAPSIMPQTVPEEIDTPLPIQLPETQPVFVPTGNPVLNPNYNPDAEPSPQNKPWLQPAVRVVPAPTPENPWQVDLQPVDRPVETGEPSPDPKVEPLADPANPPDPNQPKDQPKEETPDFCVQHPEALACAKLDTPPDTDLPTSENLSLSLQIADGVQIMRLVLSLVSCMFKGMRFRFRLICSARI